MIPVSKQMCIPPFAMASSLLSLAHGSRWSTEMSISIGGATGFSNSAQWRSPAIALPQAQSDFNPTDASGNSPSNPSASGANSSVDGIQVNLPNGFSVGVFRISEAPGQAQAATTLTSNASDSSAQMLQAVEQLVAAFAKATGNGAAPANPESFPSNGNLAPGQSMDGIDVGLPNGYSAEVYHIDEASGGTGAAGSGASSDQMVNVMEQLVANLATYPAAAASAYNKTATDTSPPTANVNSVA
jgi:hypothetical protein